MKKFLFLLYILILSSLSFAQQDNCQSGYSTIKQDELLSTVKFLASPEIHGRVAGSEGYYKAAEYMASEFKKLNLKPAFKNTYFDEFTTEYNEIKEADFYYKKNDGTLVSFELGTDFICRGFTGSADVVGQLVFCGYGISAPSDSYDDYAGINCSGSIAVVFKNNPAFKINDKSYQLSLRDKANIAKQHGCKAIVFIPMPCDAEPQKPIGSMLDGDYIHSLTDFPMVQISIEATEFLFEKSLTELKSLQKLIDSTISPHSFPISGGMADINVNAEYSHFRPTMNIAGIYEGTDPTLKNMYLVIGAHLDHVGGQANAVYFPGANDNASGSAAVLQLARAFALNKINTKYSVIFILFSNEESGLQGSTHFINSAGYKPDDIIAYLNIDCIGTGDSVRIGNGESCPSLYSLTRNIDSLNSKLVVNGTWSGGGADATPFYEKKIPALYFVTTNGYKFLHLPGDKPETLNQPLFTETVKLIYGTACSIANGNYIREEIAK